jgi:serine/threonine-protein kinase
VVTKIDRGKGEVSHRWPQILPGNKAVLFTVWTGPGREEYALEVLILESGQRRVIVRGANTGRYVQTS